MVNSKKAKKYRHLHVLDGNYYLYRAFYASFKADLRDLQGRPTGVIKFFNRMLRPLLKEQLIVVFDADGKCFRSSIYPEYKANRKPAPDDLNAQRQPIIDLCLAYGLPVLKLDGVEADDVLGTIAKTCTERKQYCTLLTGDKDITQYISEYVSCYDSKSDTRVDLRELERRGFSSPKQVAYYLALIGDSVDNVPGIKGIGAKSAMALLQQFGTLKNLVNNTDQIKGKSIRGKIESNVDLLRTCFKLVKGKTDVELPPIKFKEPDTAKVRKLLKSYNIKD